MATATAITVSGGRRDPVLTEAFRPIREIGFFSSYARALTRRKL